MSGPAPDEPSQSAPPAGPYRSPSGTARLLLLAAILVALVPLKLATSPGEGPYGLDASYYFQIARNVAEGAGLTTNVSLYHEGLDPLPAPARIYPLWPLVLGGFGSLFGLTRAANVLPPALFFLSLGILYILCRRLAFAMDPAAGGALAGRRFPLDAAHILVLAFAANPMFWSATSHPYTEGLAFALALSSFLALDTAVRRQSAPMGLTAGFLAGLAFLARSQMLIAIAAIAFVLGAVAIRSRGMRVLTATLTGGFAAPVLAWTAFRVANPPGITDVGAYQTWVESASVQAYLTERLPGLLIAFDPRSPLSYFNSFGPTVLLIPLALGWAAARATRGREHLRLEPRHILPATLVMAALLNHAILVHRHARFFLPWLFGWRHGLPLIFGLSVAVVYLLTRRSVLVRWAVVALVAVAAVAGMLRVGASRPVPSPTRAEAALGRWIDEQPAPPTMLTLHAQTLGMLTRGRFHWAECGEGPEQTRLMLERLPIEYVVVYDADRPCRFLKGLGDVLEVQHSFGRAGESRIWLLRPEPGNP